LCWAHVGRNWQAQAERGGAAARLAALWLDAQGRLFEAWHLFRGGGCSAAEWDERVAGLMIEMHEVLRRGLSSRDRVLARFCARLRDVYLDLWTFAGAPGVEPTNNHAERVQRRAVLWRRRSFGCHSADGCRFAERILTVVQSLRQQGRSVVEFLSDIITAHRQGLQYPRLLIDG